ADDRRRLTLDVSDGTVRLGGNVRTPQTKGWAEQAAASVEGAAAVRNEIRDDFGLELEAAQALERAGALRDAMVYARSSLGDVTLFGYAPSAAVVEEIVRRASAVPGARSVTSRLEVRAAAAPAAPAEAPRQAAN
ncbi:MAG: BON domain-containing protein, partial [Chloroflexi bacterium]|nr:BON domain-containing protein [Chloroflexota bacterium]